MPKRIVLCLCVLMLTGSTAASADGASPFTFRVPVDVYQMNDKVQAVRSTCYVYKGEGGETTPDLIVAHGTSDPAPLSNHSFKGTLVVNTELSNLEKNPLDARRYRCFMQVRLNNGTWYRMRTMFDDPDLYSDYLPTPNTPYTVELEGEIHQTRKDLGGGLK